jgi:hypothetical protein
MSKKSGVLFLAGALVAVACVAAMAPTLNRVEALRSPEAKVREEAERAILKDREDTIAAIEALIEESLRGYDSMKVIEKRERGEGVDRKYTSAAAAIRVLGEFRSVRSVPLLVRHQGFYFPPEWASGGASGGRAPGLSDYPASIALVEIGLPALEPVLEQYKVRDRSWAPITGWIFEKVLGKDLARAYLEHALAGEKDPQKQESVRHLLKLLPK